jgi:DNA-binding NarL/FixJ family response regulator
MAAAPISVLIVDDQRLQRDGYRMLLDSQRGISVVGDVGDGAQALAFVRRTLVDVVLMDIRMPRVNGFVATERIRSDATVQSLGPVPRIVLLTALDLDDYLPTAARAGAWAMLYKDVPPSALIEAVRGAAKNRQDLA